MYAKKEFLFFSLVLTLYIVFAALLRLHFSKMMICCHLPSLNKNIILDNARYVVINNNVITSLLEIISRLIPRILHDINTIQFWKNVNFLTSVSQSKTSVPAEKIKQPFRDSRECNKKLQLHAPAETKNITDCSSVSGGYLWFTNFLQQD